MRVVLQRVTSASVEVEGEIVSSIGNGLLVLVGIEEADGEKDIEFLCKKIANLRIFNDENGVMNLSVIDTHNDILLVSQFTLYASTKKGNRPSYIRSAAPDLSFPLYERFARRLTEIVGKQISQGIFGAEMKVSLSNQGPVTIIIDSKNRE